MSRQSDRRSLLAAVGSAGLSVGAGCLGVFPGGRSQSTAGRGTDRSIKLGIMLPTSGDLESIGEPLAEAATLPITQVEDAIDLDVEYEIVDTESDPSVGVRRAQDLAEAGYPMVNGPAASDVTLQATQQVLIPRRIVACSPASTSPTITMVNDAGLVFRTVVSDALQSLVLAEQAARTLDHQRAATLYVNNDYGWQLSQSFTRSFTADFDGTVAEQVPLDEPGSDGGSYDAELDRALATDPDLLLVVGYPETGAVLFDEFFDRDSAVDVLVTDGLRDESLQDDVGHSLDGIRGTAPLVDGPGKEHVTETFEAAYGTEPGIFAAEAFDATAVLLLANAYAGQNDGSAIRSAMTTVTAPPGEPVEPSTLAEGIELAAAGEPIEYRGASSPVSFDENGDQADATFEYWQFDEEAVGGISELDQVSV